MFRLLLVVILLAISSCKKKEKQGDYYYEKGVNATKKRNYQSCVFNLNKIDEISPYSQESKNASPILTFCHYAIKDFEAMHAEIESFESLYPASSELPYLYYLKTLSYYKIFKNHKKSLQIVDSLKNGITKVAEIDDSTEFTPNLNILLPFIEEVHEKNALYIANNYAITGNFISAASRYSQIYQSTSSHETKKIVENSMQPVLKNLGIKE